MPPFEVRQILQVGLLSDLRLQPVDLNVAILMVGMNSMDDNLGGFYRWDATSAVAEDQFLNSVVSSMSETGRWVRVFQRVRQLPHGILCYNGGIKTFYGAGTVNGSSESSVYLTMDGTAGGTAIFSNVLATNCEATANISNANDVITACRKSLSVDLKTLTYYFSRGNTQTLAGTLVAIAGTVITALRAAPSGTAVIFKAEGL